MTKQQLILEWLFNHLPLALSRGHTLVIKKYLNGVQTVLDVGCGKGFRKLFRKYESIGIDIESAFLETAKKRNNYKALLRVNINNLQFPDKSFDAVTCCEVIEHLNKEDGLKLLDRLEKIARKRIIITTPWGDDFAFRAVQLRYPTLKHLSGWLPKEFEERGYKIIPVMSLRIRLGYNLPFEVLQYGLTVIFSPFILLFPEKLCNNFAAIKDIK
jgi:ubiquinone/menaquinone biosynthesis C-methylase UbiE